MTTEATEIIRSKRSALNFKGFAESLRTPDECLFYNEQSRLVVQGPRDINLELTSPITRRYFVPSSGYGRFPNIAAGVVFTIGTTGNPELSMIEFGDEFGGTDYFKINVNRVINRETGVILKGRVVQNRFMVRYDSEGDIAYLRIDGVDKPPVEVKYREKSEEEKTAIKKAGTVGEVYITRNGNFHLDVPSVLKPGVVTYQSVIQDGKPNVVNRLSKLKSAPLSTDPSFDVDWKDINWQEKLGIRISVNSKPVTLPKAS